MSASIQTNPKHTHADGNTLESLRAAGAARFAEMGYPKATDEEWRLSNPAPIAKLNFAEDSAPNEAEATALGKRHAMGEQASVELVLSNGRLTGASSAAALPGGAYAGALAQAPNEIAEIARGLLGTIAKADATPFVALNQANLRDVVLIYAPRGVTIERPIHVVLTTSTRGPAVQSHPRVLIIAEENSELSVVETHAAGAGTYCSNVVTELVLKRDSRVDFNRIQMGSESAYAITFAGATLDRSAKLVSHAATVGGKFTRNDLHVVMAGEYADATINGLVIVGGEQHCDNHTLLDHAAANCPSHELYKHVLDGKSTCVFRGKILVREDSQKTDSKQTSKSLLLSDDAAMNSQPALEIYADDVKCTHGSTTGPVDEEMVFYLRSRGVSMEAARHLLTYAFAADITRRIKVAAVRQKLEDLLAAQHGLPQDLRITDLGQHDERAR